MLRTLRYFLKILTKLNLNFFQTCRRSYNIQIRIQILCKFNCEIIHQQQRHIISCLISWIATIKTNDIQIISLNSNEVWEI